MGGYYDDSILSGASYDANRNCQLWVRAEGTLSGSKRVVVAKVRVDTRPVQFPIAPFVSGSFNTGNNSGSKVIVDGAGQTGQVRCDSSTSGCVDFASGQLTQPGSVASDPGLSESVVDPAMVEALRSTARQNGTYYSTATPGKTTCPADPSGAVVFVEDLSCSYQAGAVVNGTTKQGIFIINRGTLEMAGNREWWGAIYLVNAQGCGTRRDRAVHQRRGQQGRRRGHHGHRHGARRHLRRRQGPADARQLGQLGHRQPPEPHV